MEMFQREQLQQMDDEDWAEMQKLFESFGDFNPVIPAPENSEEFKNQQEGIQQKPNKKRKSYSL